MEKIHRAVLRGWNKIIRKVTALRKHTSFIVPYFLSPLYPSFLLCSVCICSDDQLLFTQSSTGFLEAAFFRWVGTKHRTRVIFCSCTGLPSEVSLKDQISCLRSCTIKAQSATIEYVNLLDRNQSKSYWIMCVLNSKQPPHWGELRPYTLKSFC